MTPHTQLTASVGGSVPGSGPVHGTRAPARFLDYLAARPSDPYIDVHRSRYLQTMAWLGPLVSANARVLELGPRSVVTDFLEAERGVLVENAERDLRYPIDGADDTYDVVVSMEVFEHLKDRDEDSQSYWGRTMLTWSGIKSCLSECCRVLKPGGVLFCTTPNPSSTLAIERILIYEPAMVYAPHVREITLPELREGLTQAGFAIQRLETTWSWHAPENVTRITAALASVGASIRDRGDNTFCIAVKPATGADDVTAA